MPWDDVLWTGWSKRNHLSNMSCSFGHQSQLDNKISCCSQVDFLSHSSWSPQVSEVLGYRIISPDMATQLFPKVFYSTGKPAQANHLRYRSLQQLFPNNATLASSNVFFHEEKSIKKAWKTTEKTQIILKNTHNLQCKTSYNEIFLWLDRGNPSSIYTVECEVFSK